MAVTRTPRTICHVDMDAFFVSVELRRRPELAGQPVVVGGTGRRGVVAAASYEARRYGVFSAMPSTVAQRRCPDAVFLPGDHALYQSVSGEVLEIFRRYTPLVEPLSLDEAFLDVGGSRRLFGSGVEIAHSIRGDIERELALSCSVGVAPNKFLAKLASVEAKPRVERDGRGEPVVSQGLGVFEVVAGRERDFLAPLPVARLWGVGPKTAARLERIGARTVADLIEIGRTALVQTLGASLGGHLFDLAHGRDDRSVEPERDAKSMSQEQTFSENRTTPDELRRSLVLQADAVTSRLRAADVGAHTLSIKVRFDEGFHTITRSVTVPARINTAGEMIAALQPLLDHIDPSPGVRLFGVSASGLGPVEEQLTLDLADSSDGGPSTVARWGATSAVIDDVRRRFGDQVIGPATALDGARLRLPRRGSQQWGPDRSESPHSSPETKGVSGSESENQRPGRS